MTSLIRSCRLGRILALSLIMNSMIKNPHNNLFVSSFSDPEVLAEFLSLNLDPKLLKYMDLKKISRINESYIDEELKHSQSDLVFEVNLDNDPGYLYLALEHQSTPDHLMAFRFVKYMCRIWDDYVQKNPKTKKLPVIIPILFSQCESQWKISFAQLIKILHFRDKMDLIRTILTYSFAVSEELDS